MRIVCAVAGVAAVLIIGAALVVGCGKKTPVFPNCGDNMQNGEETDVDCGGQICTPCNAGRHCLVSSDCLSKICNGGICAAASCSDGVLNGSETDVDCGGPDCPKCADGRACAAGTDCMSCVCTGGTCQEVPPADRAGFCDAGVVVPADLQPPADLTPPSD